MPTALIEMDGTGSENYGDGELTYNWRQLDGPKVELSDPKAAKPYFRTGRPGLYRFELVVSSGSLKSEPCIVEIMIERDNQPPVAIAPKELRGEVDQPMEIDGRDSYDPEGSSLVYRWRFLSGDPGVSPEAMSKPVFSFVPKADGVFEVELVVSDGETVSGPFVTRLYIKPRPRPPVAKARAVAREIPTAPAPEQAMTPSNGIPPLARIEGPAVGKLGEFIMLDARGSRGSDQGKLSYLWRQKSGPFINDFETIYDGAAERFKPPRAGDYEFELVVRDGSLDSQPVYHNLKVVNESDPPVAVVVAPERAIPGALVKLDATQSYDLEGSPLTYRWRQTGGPKVTRYLVDDNIGDAAPAFHPPSAGTYSFELIVFNGHLQSKPVNVDIEVGDSLARIDMAIESPHVVAIGTPFDMVAKVSGGDGKPLVLNWRQSEGPAGSSGRPTGDKLNVTLPSPGRYVFDVAAVDNGRVVATARQVVEAFSGDQRPNLAAGGGLGQVFAPPPLPPAAASVLVPPPVLGAQAELEPLPGFLDHSSEPLSQPLETLQPIEPLPLLPDAQGLPTPTLTQGPPPQAIVPAIQGPLLTAPPTRITDAPPAARPVARIHPSTLGSGVSVATQGQ